MQTQNQQDGAVMAQINDDLGCYFSALSKKPYASVEHRMRCAFSVLDGRKYQFDPQGEGPNGDVDCRPSFTTRRFDCMTFCDTVLAMVHAGSVSSMLRAHRIIRYMDGSQLYFHRHHFVEGTWIHHNRKNGFLAGFPNIDGGTMQLMTRKTILNYPKWLDYQAAYIRDKITPSVSLESLTIPSIYHNPCTLQFPYISLKLLINDDNTVNMQALSLIPSGCVLMLIAKEPTPSSASLPKRISAIATDLAVTHLGFVTKADGHLIFTHAQIGHQIVSVTLASYLQSIHRHSRYVAGIALERIQDRIL
tara:strand:+ start:132 stop:1046 length:915 start_codon:yes stop_codon:yes gene_type:complete